MKSPRMAAGMLFLFQTLFLVASLEVMPSRGAQLPPPATGVPEVSKIDCSSKEISVTIDSGSGNTPFNGMIYPKGLSRNSSCMTEYIMERGPLHYRLPLRSCNTMSAETVEGVVEYFNTIVVQPHRKLLTNQGRGFQLSCRYRPMIDGASNEEFEEDPTTLLADAPKPAVTMRIFSGDPRRREVAENAKIGDPLTMVISIDEQEVYGLKITDCLVRDGLGWGEQRLIDTSGCPVDREIMGTFEYGSRKVSAMVHFPAHKFPYTSSVYYQCNARLCLKGGGCEDVPPNCDGKKRLKREKVDDDGSTPATIEVYTGLHVNEATDIGRPDQLDLISREETPVDPNSICVSQRSFAIGIAIAGLILMLMVVAAFLVLMARRNTRKDVSTVAGSSVYSGPYTNTAYSRSS